MRTDKIFDILEQIETRLEASVGILRAGHGSSDAAMKKEARNLEAARIEVEKLMLEFQ